jgi:murein DD-endopeptidase MepM/ murein hydrolase activator NlpD
MTPPAAPSPGERLFAGEAVIDAALQRAIESSAFALDPIIVEQRKLPHTDTVTLSGVIHSNLYEAMDSTAENDLPAQQRRHLVIDIADIFETKVDMSRDLQDGDRFHVLVERLQQPNGKIIYRKVLGAMLALSGKELEAINYASPGSKSGRFFDRAGRALKSGFLKSPLSFAYISSVFSSSRKHPVLGSWRAHKGTDYAARYGTPVKAVGDGVVIFAGQRGGYGNVIDVRHSNGYVSRYGHLSRFARSARVGNRVTKSQEIGYVGATGLATGPHLHFEMLVNGRQRDPSKALRSHLSDPIPLAERPVFESWRARMLSMLRVSPSGGPNVASQTPTTPPRN